jgi:hypothetical protein
LNCREEIIGLYITILLESDAQLAKGRIRTMNNDDEIELKKHLLNISRRGVDLYLEGEPASPEEIARKFYVCEEDVYMPDFVMDEHGRLKEVRYDKIKYR